MITGTSIEVWVAIAFFYICIFANLSDFEKINLPPQLMRILCISLIVIGGYTCINGFINLDWITEWIGIISGDGFAEKALTVRKGVLGMIVLTVWPILAILFGGWTFMKSLNRYRRT